MLSKLFSGGSDQQLNVCFGYQCTNSGTPREASEELSPGTSGKEVKLTRNNSSFSCLSGAALSANPTLANTTLCNGLIASSLLPELDSPNNFRSVPSSPSLSSMDIISSSLHCTGLSHVNSYVSSPSDGSDSDMSVLEAISAPSRTEGFLSALEVKMAGGAAGEDRVQAVCSEENGWLFCAIYDGFSGRDAADFLAGTLYENIGLYLRLLSAKMKQGNLMESQSSCVEDPLQYFLEGIASDEETKNHSDQGFIQESYKDEDSHDAFRVGVLDCLQQALARAETDFLSMVEQDIDVRPDLVSVGSCVLVVLLSGQNLYTLGLGDSRAVLARSHSVCTDSNEHLEAIQLNEAHNVDNERERLRVLSEHPDDPKTIVKGRVKGILRLTRAFGVGYMKKKKLNDALMGILKVQNLHSPPYISTQPSLNIHRVSRGDQFVIVASDGLFDFFSNEEAVELIDSYIQSNPLGCPAQFLVEQLVERAAQNAGMSMEELMAIPAGGRRKYHDDVTVIIVLLGNNQRTATASTCLEA